MLPYCRDTGVGVIPWSPLARGLLARGRDGAGQTTRARTDEIAARLYDDDDYAVADAVVALAQRRGVPPAQIALAWLLHQPVVTAPIIGASRAGHVDDAVAAVGLRLDEEELAELAAPYRPHPVLGHE